MNTKDKILNAMFKLIAEKGYEGSSIGQICEIVGISKPAVYYYFKSKEEIFIELFQTIIDGTNEVFNMEKLNDITTVDSYYNYLIDEYNVFLESYLQDKQSHLVTIEFSIQSNRMPIIMIMQNELILKILNELKEILKRGQKLGAFAPSFDINKNAEYLYTTLQGCDCSIMYNMPIDTAIVWKMAVDFIFSEQE
jgi:AcrR family transcriptional regulator